MQRLALGVEYIGTNYSGWQRQKDPAVRSVQADLEAALSVVADHPVTTVAAGRTDAGVHASGQVVHFDTTALRTERAWVFGSNTNLPCGIRVLWVKAVPPDFDARLSAQKRHYKYIIYNNNIRPSLLHEYVGWHYAALDAAKMHQAAQHWLGEHDFSSFRAVGCQSRSAVRTVSYITVKRSGELIVFDIMANAFLYHMVRNMVGSLCSIGTGKMPVEWSHELLLARDRTKASATAAPQGLYLVGVYYPDELQIPCATTNLWFLKQG
jgi:tRNA pseudouridine38-40 synthase